MPYKINKQYNEETYDDDSKLLTKIATNMSQQGDSRVITLLENFYKFTHLAPYTLKTHIACARILKSQGFETLYKKVTQLCEEILEENPAIDLHFHPNVTFHVEWAHFLYEINERKRALKSLNNIKIYYNTSTPFINEAEIIKSYLSLIHAYKQQQLETRARQIKNQLNYKFDLHDVKHRITYLKHMFHLALEENNTSEAIKYFYNQQITAINLIVLIDHLLQNNKVAKAIEIYDSIDELSLFDPEGYKLKSHTNIILHLFNHAKIDQCIKRLGKETSGENKRAIYNELFLNLTVDTLDTMLSLIGQETGLLKEELSRELIKTIITLPSFGQDEFLKVLAHVLNNEETIRLALDGHTACFEKQ